MDRDEWNSIGKPSSASAIELRQTTIEGRHFFCWEAYYMCVYVCMQSSSSTSSTHRRAAAGGQGRLESAQDGDSHQNLSRLRVELNWLKGRDAGWSTHSMRRRIIISRRLRTEEHKNERQSHRTTLSVIIIAGLLRRSLHKSDSWYQSGVAFDIGVFCWAQGSFLEETWDCGIYPWVTARYYQSKAPVHIISTCIIISSCEF